MRIIINIDSRNTEPKVGIDHIVDMVFTWRNMLILIPLHGFQVSDHVCTCIMCVSVCSFLSKMFIWATQNQDARVSVFVSGKVYSHPLRANS